MDVKIIHYHLLHNLIFDERLVMTSKMNSFYIHSLCQTSTESLVSSGFLRSICGRIAKIY